MNVLNLMLGVLMISSCSKLILNYTALKYEGFSKVYAVHSRIIDEYVAERALNLSYYNNDERIARSKFINKKYASYCHDAKLRIEEMKVILRVSEDGESVASINKVALLMNDLCKDVNNSENLLTIDYFRSSKDSMDMVLKEEFSFK